MAVRICSRIVFAMVVSLFAFLFSTLFPAFTSSAYAQQYDLLLKGGTVIDIRNDRHESADVAIAEGRIAAVAPSIPATQAEKVVDVTGLYVVPGLVDMHGHVFPGPNRGAHAAGQYSVFPDDHTLRACTTTIADGGSSGWRNFERFHYEVVELSQTRVLVWLNILGMGLSGRPLSQNLADMDPEPAVEMAMEYPDVVVGFKTVQWESREWTAVEKLIEAGDLANLPIMVDFGRFWPDDRPYEELVLERMRPGDISTHMYNSNVPLFDENGNLRDYLEQARDRGVLFDLGHGLGNFDYEIVVPAVRQGWWPDAISTDLHAESAPGPVKSLTNVMSKMMNLGIPLRDILYRTTWRPAQIMGREDLGHLSEGGVADVSVLRLKEGEFGFLDIWNVRMPANEKLQCELTIRNGDVVWDLNGLAARESIEQP